MTMVCGAYGKMPSVGDFFHISPPPGFVKPWDAWLQDLLTSTRQALGEAWDARYMSAPIWRFSLAAGLVGPGRVLGVLMPSVDRVGRRFPLTLMAALDSDAALASDHAAARDLFDHLDQLALDALEDDMTRNALSDRLAASPTPTAPQAQLNQIGTTLLLNGPLPALGPALLETRISAPSLWSCDIGGQPRLMICDGLPARADMQILIDPETAPWCRG